MSKNRLSTNFLELVCIIMPVWCSPSWHRVCDYIQKVFTLFSPFINYTPCPHFPLPPTTSHHLKPKIYLLIIYVWSFLVAQCVKDLALSLLQLGSLLWHRFDPLAQELLCAFGMAKKNIKTKNKQKKIVYVSFSTCSWFNSSVWSKSKLVSMIFEERFLFIYLQTWGFTMTIISKKGFVNWHTWILIPVLPQRCYISYT